MYMYISMGLVLCLVYTPLLTATGEAGDYNSNKQVLYIQYTPVVYSTRTHALYIQYIVTRGVGSGTQSID